MKIKRVKLDEKGIQKIVPGDMHGGGVTVLTASEKLSIVPHPELGGLLVKGTRTVWLPEHRVLEVEFEPEVATAGKK